jgi:4-hydroxyphenylacetate 3-monooxygenase
MYAFTATVPIGAKGLKLLSRRSYAAAATHSWDYPLSTRLDENDSVIYFDEVKIPWDRVFVHRNAKMSFAQFHETPAHVYQNYQSMIRLAVKLRFFTGLARRITETIGTGQFPQVKDSLGLIASQAEMIDAYVHAMEAKGSMYGPYFVPDRATLYSAGVQAQRLYPAVVEALRDLSGGAMIMLPSSAHDFGNPEMAEVIQKVQQSPVTDAKGRVKLFKLAWDAVGSEFASRHVQYEMFYSGPKQFTAGHMTRTYDWDRATALVDRTLQAYSLPEEKSIKGAPAAPAKVAR